MPKIVPLLAMPLLFLFGCEKELPPVPEPEPEPESRPAKLFSVTVGNSAFERRFPATTEAGDRAVLAYQVCCKP